MPDLTRSGSAIIMPTNSYSTQDLEQAKFTVTNGTVSVNTSAGAGGTQPVSGTVTSLNGTTTPGTLQNAVSGTAIGGTLNASGQTSIAIQVLGTFVGTIAFEASLDNTNWVAYNMVQDAGNVVGTIATSTGLFRASAAGLLGVRARVSAYTSGTLSVLSRAAMEVLHPIVVNADLPQALSSSIDSVVSNPFGFTYQNIAGTAGTVVIKGSSGTLHNLIVNTPVASDVITLYDNASGTSAVTIARILIPAVLVSEGPNPAVYNVAFANGLVVAHSGTSDLTIGYK